MLELTWERAARIVPSSHIVIVCGRQHAEAVRRLVPIAGHRLLAEPARRNTAACIGIANLYIQQHDPAAVCCMMPADHLIEDGNAFRHTVEQAFVEAEEHDRLMLIGVQPSEPATGYGYIKIVRRGMGDGGRKTRHEKQATSHELRATSVKPRVSRLAVYEVERFVEKPSVTQASRYTKNSMWLWNSGIFVWKAETILQRIYTHLPELGRGLQRLASLHSPAAWNGVLDQLYRRLPSISIDRGVLQRERGLGVIKAPFDWRDVGTWPQLEQCHPTDAVRNRTIGQHVGMDTQGSTIIGMDDRLIATLGVSDLLIVQTADATFICPKSRIDGLRSLVQRINGHRRLRQYL